MKSFYEFFCESIFDPKNETYDKTIFDEWDTQKPRLAEVARSQILLGSKAFESFFGEFKNIILIGSILGKNYNDTTDLDINIEVEEKKKDFPDNHPLWEVLKNTNGRFVPGTKHPVNYHIIFLGDDETEDERRSRFDSMYDVINNEWIKKSASTKKSLKKTMEEHRKEIEAYDALIMELRRNLVEFEKLSDVTTSKNDLKLKQQRNVIFKTIKEMIDMVKDLHDKRIKAYDRKLDKKKYKSKNDYPENIVWKLFERYNYLDLDKILKDLTLDDSFELKNVINLKSILKQFF